MAEPTCTICQKTGPVLMPLRYAIVPDTITQQLPAWATPQTAFPALSGYHYALRAVRQGFIYVFYNTGALPENAGFDWECWSVAENGDLYYQGTTGLGAQPVFNPLPCGRPVHKATNLEHMALSEKALKYETWVAFSHAPWEAEALDLYTRNANARAKRMQNITPAEWNSHIMAQENGLVQASEAALNTVLDYQTTPPFLLRDEERPTYRVSSLIDGQYGFYPESVNPHTTFHAWSRQRAGGAERSINAMKSRCQARSGKPISPLILALHDPVGIAHELAHWGDSLALAHQCYLDELSVEFATWRNINGVKSQVAQMSSAQVDVLFSNTGTNSYSANYAQTVGHIPKQEYDVLVRKNRESVRSETIALDWSKYTKKLAPGKLEQFAQAYDSLCKELDKQTRALMGLRIDWLQDSRFITCIQDHNSSRVEDNLYYREIVGYAVASLNVAPAGRQLIQTWINAYSTKEKTNLFWRSLFFNDPALMQEMSPVLDEMKKQAAKKDQPVKETDKPAILTAVNSFMSAFGKFGESCDRALEALEKQSSSGNQSLVRRILAWADRRLTTFTSEVFNKTVMGGNLDTANELFYKWLFARDAGVEEKQIQALLSSQMDTGPQGATAFRYEMMKAYRKNPEVSLREAVHNKYSDEFQKMLRSPEGRRHIEVSRIKLLGVFLNMWEFLNQSEEALKGEGSVSGFMSAALFTASAGIQVALPAWEVMAKVSQGGAASLIGNMPPQGAKLSTWKLRANCCGSFAAALAVVSDLGDLQKSFDKEGAKRWQAVSLAGVKVLSDGAFAIQSSEGLLELLGKQGAIGILKSVIANNTGSLITQTAAGLTLDAISILASWEVMILVSIAPTIVAIFTDNDLQDWCEKCVFGSSSDIENPRDMTAEGRAQISQEQEDKLVKALHETFGLPLTEKLQQEEDEEKLKQLKAEVQAWQHIHN
ncbi:T6SS effector BTH_I2691 family protein [Enterobacter vonholyi]